MDDDIENLESSVAIIQKIKLQDQDNEARLKEKLEFDTVVITLNRAIRDSQMQIQKYKHETEDLRKAINKIESQFNVEKARRDALIQLIEHSRKEFNELQKKSDDGVSSVWTLRSTLLEATQKVSDKCDLWAMLVKPTHTDIPPTKATEVIPKSVDKETLVKKSLERRERAIAERNRLLGEPDSGDEFIRIKNAIQYSMEMTANAAN